MRIFLASPGDVVNYRESAKRVAERLNRQQGAKLGSEDFLEVVDWNTHVAELLSLPESAILEELEVGEHDAFLGIAWLAFDHRSAGGDGDALSTERNFELAFNYWRERGPDRCFLCRCMRLPEKLTDIDGRAFDRVSRFFSRFSIDAENPVRYYEFDSATDLEEHLAVRFVELIAGLGGASSKPAPAPAAAPESSRPAAASAPVAPAAPAAPAAAGAEEAEPEPQFERKMEPGKAYEVSFLSIEIVETEQIAQAKESRGPEVETLYRSFRQLVRTTAASYGGEVFRWRGGGGLVIFWSNRSYDHAIMTGLKVLHNLPVFNLDPAQNPGAFSVRTSAAAHDAVIIFQRPTSEIGSSDLDFVVDLQEQHTDPGELTITRRLVERIDGRLKPHFKFKDRFESEPIYACRLPSSERVPSKATLDDFSNKLLHQTAKVRETLDAAPSEVELSALDTMSTAVDQLYSVLNRFCTSFSSVDPEWPPEFFTELGNATAALTEEEHEVWSKLRKAYVGGSYETDKARKLEAVVQAASRRRARPVVILERLGERCRALARPGEEKPPAAKPGEVDDELIKRMEAFVKADVLDNETVLTDLLLNRKSALVEYLTGHRDDQRHQRLLDKLWETADLVLVDDLFSIRGRKRANESRVSDVLVAEPIAEPRFRILRALLADDREPTDELLVEEFERVGLRVSDDDLQIVWRSMVLGHENAEIRHFSAFKLTLHSTWQAISQPSIPITSIYAIGERINKVENDDAKKIFFDCIRARLEHAVESFRNREEVSSLTKLILLLLDFPFLVESGYFERFDDILGKFLERASQAKLKVDYFESLRRTLEEARAKSSEKGPSKPPAGLKKLPLTLQRRLAGESRYVYWFVSHPDPRIAGETLRHVGLMNVERVLKMREVNKAVFTALLRKPELFTRTQALIAALNHPKCDQHFASRHVPSLARTRAGQQELQKIVNNPSANPVVRAAAKRALAGHARAMAR